MAIDPAASNWSQRFEQGLNPAIERFNASIGFDINLLQQDLDGSVAHARMLGSCGVISEAEALQLIEGLEAVRAEAACGSFQPGLEAEDVHFAVERRLIELLGSLGKKLHTGRSRNDQVGTDLRLWLRSQIDAIDGALLRFERALLVQAELHSSVLIPGYTHLQRAQPVCLAHHLLAYIEMAERDRSRLADVRGRVNCCPLGAAALAMVHLSRLSEEVILWASQEFGFIWLTDRCATGSSLMPQKKNPDVAELVRGKSGRVFGHLMGLLTMIKGLPLAYNKDFQEDKEALFDGVRTCLDCLEAMAILFEEGLEFRPERLEAAVAADFSNATDVADYLVAKGVPFREAYQLVGGLVKDCLAEGILLRDLPLERWQLLHAAFEIDIHAAITPRQVVAARRSEGGTGFDQVQQQLQRIRSRLDS